MSRPSVIAGLLALACTSAGASGQEAGTTLDQVLELARDRNPELRALRALASAVEARRAAASTLPDPGFMLGVTNVGIPDFSADRAMTMAPMLQLTQTVPFPGKLGLRGDMSALDVELAEQGVAEAWWSLRARVASLFLDLYAVDRRIAVRRETLRLLGDFETVARALYASGSGRQADVLRASVEVARVDGELRDLEARRSAGAARLNALLDRGSGAELGAAVPPRLPSSVPEAATLRAWAEETRPALVAARLAVERARAGGRLARKELWPDLMVGLQYGQRDRGQGVERMGGATVGFSLPVFAGRRQLRARDEAAAMQSLADARLRGKRAQVDARILELTAELGRTRTLIRLYREEVLPQARATVDAAFSSYRVGEVDFLTLMDAELTVNRFEDELHTLVAEYGKALAGMEAAVGRALPVLDGAVMEVP